MINTIYDEEDKMDDGEQLQPPAYYHGKAMYIKKQLSQENYSQSNHLIH